jgi:hypothetical protein
MCRENGDESANEFDAELADQSEDETDDEPAAAADHDSRREKLIRRDDLVVEP